MRAYVADPTVPDGIAPHDVPSPTREQASRSSNYKVPRHIFVFPENEVPRLHSGKPDKRALSE
jgi:hypothetical protein